MKKLFSTILVLGLLLSGNAFSEILKLNCIVENGKPQIYEFDLKNKNYTTLLGKKIDIAFTENEIIFQSYIGDHTIISFEVSRNNGEGFIKIFDYNYEFKEGSKDKLFIQFAHSHVRYPGLSDEDKALFAIRDYSRKHFKPTSESKVECSKMINKF